MDFLYDESGSAYSFIYNGTQYSYVRNLQGDVVKILNTSGGVSAGLDTFGALNDLTNAVYYNYISDGESDLTSSSHADKHINRWDRLDYVKSQPGMPDTYTDTVRNYYAEYDVHVAAWRTLGWAYNKNYGIFSKGAEKAQDADVEYGKIDTRPEVYPFTKIFEFLGF